MATLNQCTPGKLLLVLMALNSVFDLSDIDPFLRRLDIIYDLLVRETFCSLVRNTLCGLDSDDLCGFDDRDGLCGFLRLVARHSVLCCQSLVRLNLMRKVG